jgi:hypothetical protein
VPFSLLVKYILENEVLANEFEKSSGISRDVLKTFNTSKNIPDLILLVNRVSTSNETLQLTDELQGGIVPIAWVLVGSMLYVTKVLHTELILKQPVGPPVGSPVGQVARYGDSSYGSSYGSQIAQYGAQAVALYGLGDSSFTRQLGAVDYITYWQAAAMTNAQIEDSAVFIKAENVPLMLTLNGNTPIALQTVWQLGSPQQVDAMLQSYYQAFILVSEGALESPLQLWTNEAAARLENGLQLPAPPLALPAPQLALPAPELPAPQLPVPQLAMPAPESPAPQIPVQLALPVPAKQMQRTSAGVGPRRPTFVQFKKALVGANISNPEDPRTQVLTAFAPLITTFPNGSSPLSMALERKNITVTPATRVITDSSWSPGWLALGVAVVGAAGIKSVLPGGLLYSYLFSQSGICYAATYVYAGDVLVTYQYGQVGNRPPGWYTGANQNRALDDARIRNIPKVFQDEVEWKTAAGAGTPAWPWRSYKEVIVPAQWKSDLDALIEVPFSIFNLFSAGTNAEYAVTTGRSTDNRDVYFNYESREWKFQNQVTVDVARIPQLLQLEVQWKIQQGAGGAWRRGTYQAPRRTAEYRRWAQELEREYKAAPVVRNVQLPWPSLVDTLRAIRVQIPKLDISALWKKSFPGVPLQPLEFYPPPRRREEREERRDAQRVQDIMNTTAEGRRSAVDMYEMEAREGILQRQAEQRREVDRRRELEARIFDEIRGIEETSVRIRERIAAVRAKLN